MREWLVSASEYAILMVDGMALVVVVFASIEAFLQAVRLVVLRTSALQGRDVWLRFLRLLVAALTFQLGRRHHRDRHFDDLGVVRPHRCDRRRSDLPELLPGGRPS